MDKGTAKPDWLRVRLGGGPACGRMRSIIRQHGLRTVCEEALCPNLGRCWENGRATIMILGATCSRACAFCNVTSGPPQGGDADEPRHVAEAVKAMELKDVVITSVTRDDLPDGGASVWAKTVRGVHDAVPGISVEVLIPDFGGKADALQAVAASGPDVLGHNLETVASLYPRVRPQAGYTRSLALLRRARGQGMLTKTGIMVGLGETAEEVLALMRDARKAGCEIFTVGQYLQPTRRHLPVHRFAELREFDAYRSEGLHMGFAVVVAGPLVRSSYHSGEQAAYVSSRRRLE